MTLHSSCGFCSLLLHKLCLCAVAKCFDGCYRIMGTNEWRLPKTLCAHLVYLRYSQHCLRNEMYKFMMSRPKQTVVNLMLLATQFPCFINCYLLFPRIIVFCYFFRQMSDAVDYILFVYTIFVRGGMSHPYCAARFVSWLITI